jgi:hypothetical protein
MTEMNLAKLHVTFAEGTSPEGPITPRAYTLTHSDASGDLFLTIGLQVNGQQIAGWYTRLMRDEVVAEWQTQDAPALHVHCHVSGGIVVGPARWRDGIFRSHLPMVLRAFRHADACLFEAHPALDQARVIVHFHARQARYDRVETWGALGDHRAGEGNGAER